jgi:DNA polymerase-3 subunit epsilon
MRCAAGLTPSQPDSTPANDNRPMPAPTQTQTQTVAVIDFETTGMGPGLGARATEIAAVLVRDGRIVGHYQSLMNSGTPVPLFIERLTGISNAMLADAPPCAQVMHELFEFTAGLPLVAHNAAFDRGFWLAEAALAGLNPDPGHAFACTLLLARRLWPEASDHKLGSLARQLCLPRDGRAHRALSDARVTAELWLQIEREVQQRFAEALAGRGVDHRLLSRLQRAPRHRLQQCLAAAAG